MTDTAIFQERVVKVPIPEHHYTLLVSPNGNYLGVDDEGFTTTYPVGNDRVMWDETESGSLRSAVGDIEVVKESVDANVSRLTLDGHTLDDVGGPSSTGVLYNVEHGPEKLPSEYLEFFRKNGWVCLPCLLYTSTLPTSDLV